MIDWSRRKQLDLHAFPARVLCGTNDSQKALSARGPHGILAPGSPHACASAATLPTSPRPQMPGALLPQPTSPRGKPPLLKPGALPPPPGASHAQSSSTPSVRPDSGVMRGWHVNTGQTWLARLAVLDPLKEKSSTPAVRTPAVRTPR